MKKVLSVLVAIFLFGSLNAQTTPIFEEDFSGGIPSTWTMYNDNNTVYPGFAESYGWPSNVAWFAGSAQNFGSSCAVSLTYFSSTTAEADRWLITPSFNVTEEHTFLSFYAGAGNTNYPEKLLVKASTTNTEKESFTIDLLNVQQLIGSYYYIDLSQFVGQSVHIAFIAKSVDGLLLMLAEVQAQVMPQYNAMIAAVSTPKYAPMGGNANVTTTIYNMGYEPITSFNATYTVDGTTSAVMNVTGINVPLGEYYTFTHNAPYVCNEIGDKTFTTSISAINGSEVAATDPYNLSSITNFYDASLTFARKNVLEQFTGERCPNCPRGSQFLAQALASRNDVIWLTHHAGYYDDSYTIPASKALTFLYNDRGTYAPAFMVNRANVTSDPGPVTGVGSVAGITEVINAAGEIPSYGTVAFENMAYNAETRTVTGTVKMHMHPDYIPASPKLSVFFSEDSIRTFSQSGANGAYYHMNTARACLNNNNFGDAVTFDANGDATFSINYTVPENFNVDQSTFVAILANHNAANANDCEVINAAEIGITTGVGISQASNIELSIYPNPATEAVNVVAEENINSVRVMNTLGQVVYTNSNVNAESIQLNVNDYAAGMYIITVNTDKGTCTQRVMVR